MRRGENSRTLKTLVEVRTVQRLGAEMALSRADAALRRREAEREQALQQLTADQQHWADAVEGASLGLSLARAWAGDILTGEETLRRKQDEVARAREERAERASEWRAADARCEAISEIAREAGRRDARRRDEAALSDLEDRFAHWNRARP